jgi:hypothetical protein
VLIAAAGDGPSASLPSAIVWAAVPARPVIRAIWWWTPETVITGSLIFGWTELAEHHTLVYRLAFTAAITCIPADSSRRRCSEKDTVQQQSAATASNDTDLR